MGLILDTNFIIVAEREAKSGVTATIDRALAAQGQLIGANDMWIAATALVYGMGVVTNNMDEFKRVPGLTVASY